MKKINSYQIGSGSPLTEQECLEMSWQPVRDDAEKWIAEREMRV